MTVSLHVLHRIHHPVHRNASDYEDWRDVPLLTALSYGVSSVEADVYLVNGTLYVRESLHLFPAVILKVEITCSC